MFIVAWEGQPPPDKDEWTAVLREVLAGEVGSYRVVFRSSGRGWRFELEWREDGDASAGEVIANGPESVGYNIYVNLAGSGKPIDAGWQPWKREEKASHQAPAARLGAPAQAGSAKAGSSSRAGRRSRPASGRRTRPGR